MSQYGRELAEYAPYLWLFQPRRCTLDAVTGQVGTIVQTAGASAYDSYGTIMTIVRDRPRWSVLGGQPSLQCGTNTFPHWGDWRVAPTVDICGLLDFYEIGPTSSGGVLHLGGDTVTGQNRLTIYYSPNSYRILLSDGTNSVASVATVQPSAAQRIRLRWRLRLSGGQHYVRIWQSINGGAEVAATESSGLTAITSYGTNPKLRLNSIGTGNAGAAGYYGGVIATGDQPLERLLEALAP